MIWDRSVTSNTPDISSGNCRCESCRSLLPGSSESWQGNQSNDEPEALGRGSRKPKCGGEGCLAGYFKPEPIEVRIVAEW